MRKSTKSPAPKSYRSDVFISSVGLPGDLTPVIPIVIKRHCPVFGLGDMVRRDDD